MIYFTVLLILYVALSMACVNIAHETGRQMPKWAYPGVILFACGLFAFVSYVGILIGEFVFSLLFWVKKCTLSQ